MIDIETAMQHTSQKEIVICVQDLSKTYLLYDKPQDRLKQSMVPRLQRLLGLRPRSYFREFWALRNISFDVRQGETIGIIGRNGAGKSTLLQILCGTLHPNSGIVRVRGRVAALLELGSSFNPEFTGVENVYLYGNVIGLSREEVDDRFDDIAAFADIGNFMNQAIKTYSSGMQVRLAFAVAACIDPDILIVDEALAVGDIRFQAKCFRRLEQLVQAGTSVLFVSHSLELITRHCNRAILLEKGVIEAVGSPTLVTNRYLDLLFGVDRQSDNSRKELVGTSDQSPIMVEVMPEGVFEQREGYNPSEYRWGSREAELVDFLVTMDGRNHVVQLETGSRVIVLVKARFYRDVAFPIFGLTIKTPDGITVFGCNSRDCAGGPVVRPACAGETLGVRFSFDQLLCSGQYFISLGVAEGHEGAEALPLDRRYDAVLIIVTNAIARSFGIAELNMAVSVQ